MFLSGLRVLALAIGALAVSACARPLTSEPPFEPGTSVLFTGVFDVAFVCESPLEEVRAWTPTMYHIRGADEAFAAILEPGSTPRRAPNAGDVEAMGEAQTNNLLMLGSAMYPRPRAREYVRQFGGTLGADGRQLVCINAIHRDVIERDNLESWWDNWRRTPVGYIDGGWIQIRAVYDVETRTIRGFRPNSEA